nr:uncharacterized protein LOC113729174 [Coffea arabica]
MGSNREEAAAPLLMSAAKFAAFLSQRAHSSSTQQPLPGVQPSTATMASHGSSSWRQPLQPLHRSNRRQVWEKIEQTLGLHIALSDDIMLQLQNWWSHCSRGTLQTQLTQIIPLFTYWELWKARNTAIYEGGVLAASQFYHRVIELLHGISLAHPFTSDCSNGMELHRMVWLHISKRSKPTRCLPMAWSLPTEPFVKLNVDGASLGNPGSSGGGGIVRSSSGQVIAAFSSHYEYQTNMKVAAKALFEGLKLCLALGCIHVEVEMDSLVLLNIVKGLHSWPWRIDAKFELGKARVWKQFWKQKARVRWLQEGDRNTRFFHSVVKNRRVRSIIHRIRNGQGEWVESDDGIGVEAIRYFEGLFTDQRPASSSELLQHIPTILTDEENDLLEQFPSAVEIRNAVFAMDGESAPGPDGYTGKFFTVAWSVVGADVVSAVCSFFCGAELPRAITATSIALIPKVGHPQDFSQFRPISLCNFVNKLISRILADRLARILPRIISPQQSGFVRGRLISDNFLLAQELLSNIGRTSRNADVALKLDMSKAYDRVSWFFLTMVLRRFGFREQWIDRIWRLVSNVWFSVLINGASVGFFKSTRGLRQGDRYPQIIGKYEAVSGQEINVQKSGFMVHAKLPSQCVARIRRVTGFGLKSFPVRYLGCPLFVGRRKCLYFMELVQSVISKVSSWRSRFLSNGGRIVLIKHVLSAIPTHLLAASCPPKGVLALVERAMANFLWGEREGGLRHHWIKWADLCADSSQGGVGVRSLLDVHTAFSFKLWWRFRTGECLWATFMRAKYCRQSHPCMVAAGQGSSYMWRRLLQIREVAEQNLWWEMRSGQCNFWFDNWMGSGPLCQRLQSVSDHLVRDFVLNGRWNQQLLRLWVPDDIVSEIITKVAPVGSADDRAVWALTESGDFSIASTYVLLGSQTPSSFMFDRVWHPVIPIKISFFMVRLLRDRLPLASSLGRLQVYGPSKCFCCLASQSESLDHVFAEGELALFLWTFFGNSAGVSYRGMGVRSRLAAWWCQPVRYSRLESLHSVLPCIICWHIWLARNLAIFEGQLLRRQTICDRILADVVGLFSKKFAGEFFGVGSWSTVLSIFSGWRPRYSHRVVCWEFPVQGAFKLNTDGCSLGNPGVGGGGGVLRDSSGALLFGFSVPFGELTCLQAEIKALVFGVQQCRLRGFSRIRVEVDSLVLVNLLVRQFRCPWSVRSDLESLRAVQGLEWTVGHCYREMNQVADALAKVGAHSEGIILYTTQSELPRVARGALGLDRSQIPAIRTRAISH